MTDLGKKVTRKSSGSVYEKGKKRRILFVLLPPAKVGVRLEGTQQTYTLDAEEMYSIAVKMHIHEVEKLAKQIAKSDGVKIRSARAVAAKQLSRKLKV